MSILLLDPGPIESGWAVMNGKDVIEHGISKNEEFLPLVEDGLLCYCMAYEMFACYGMPVGSEVFDACLWMGRFVQAFPGKTEPVFRKDVKLHLCGNVRAKDGNIRQAILDMYPATGGGKTPQVGTKKQPGPLFGVSKHVWPAIAVGLTYQGIRR